MPTDDIDTLSGPELSAAVAKDVMGWHIGTYFARDDYWFSANENGICAEYQVAGWRPHTDRNDAHAVLKRFGEIGGDWSELMRLIQGSEQGKRHFGMRLGLIVDPTIICRAALRAVRERR